MQTKQFISKKSSSTSILQKEKKQHYVKPKEPVAKLINLNLMPDLSRPMADNQQQAHFTRLQQTHGNQFLQRMMKQDVDNVSTVQRQVDGEDEKVSIQTKINESVQRQEEEEGPIQAKMDESIQLQSDDEKKEREELNLVQTKLRIGQPGDKYEQEADHVAEQITQMSEPHKQRQQEDAELNQQKSHVMQNAPLVQRQIEEDDKEILQPKKIPGNPGLKHNTANIESRINTSRGGKSIIKYTRSFIFRITFRHKL